MELRLVPIVLVAAAFGPYLWRGVGIRTEQLVVYVLSAVLLPRLIFGRVRLHRGVVAVAALWSGVIALAAASVAGDVAAGATEARLDLATLDGLLMPLACVVVISGVLGVRGPSDRYTFGQTFSAAVCTFLAANSTVILAGRMGVNVEQVLEWFWQAPGYGAEAVAARAARQGRLGGIFNQPFEAGVAYSLGLLFLVCGLRGVRSASGRVVQVALLALILMGGILSGSKVFLLGGVPLVLISIGAQRAPSLRLQRRGRVLAYGLGGVGLAVGVISQVGFPGGGRLAMLFDNAADRSILQLYSAGRFGTGGSVARLMDTVITEQPWFGFGLRKPATAMDSLWIEMLVLGGLVGVGLVGLLLAIVLWCLLRFHRDWSGMTRAMPAGGLVGLVLISSLGGPALTGNRIASLIWISLTLALVERTRAQLLEPRLERGGFTDWRPGLAMARP